MLFYVMLILLLIAGPMRATAAEQAASDQRIESPAPSPDLTAPVTRPTATQDAGPTRVPDSFPTLGEYFGDIPSDMVGSTKAIFTHDNMPIALWGSGATLVAFTLDQSVQKYFEDHQPLGSGSLGAKIGEGYMLAAGAAGLFLAGEVLGDRKLADTGMATSEALVVDVVATEVIKYITHRKRPNGGDNMSFPSGHVSATAAFSASVSEMYDWNPFIAVPLYTVTAFVAASRMQGGEHHLSDVVAGATLGTIIGKSFSSHMKKKRTGTQTGMHLVGVVPLFGVDCRGFVAMLEY